MAIKRFRYDIAGELSTTPGSILTTNVANRTVFLAPPAGDRIAFYDNSAGLLQWLTLGAGLSFNGTVLETTAGAGFISDIQDEGSSLGAGLTTINFVGAGINVAAAGAVANVTLDGDLNALAGLGSIGYAVRTGSDTWAQRTLTGTSGRLSVTNGDGTSGNPVFNIDTNVAFKNANETISGTWTFSNNVTLNGTPVLGTDGVNKSYVDGLIAGVRRAYVNVATTANITLSGEQTLDGYLTSASRVLVKDQTLTQNNGIWVSAAGAWTRATDMDAAGEVNSTLVLVGNGTTQQGQLWYTVSTVVTLNTDPIVFTKLQTGVIYGSGAEKQVTVWVDSDIVGGNTSYLFDATTSPQLVIGDTAVTALTVLTTKGTTANNAAFGWSHKDSTGTQVFRVANDGTTVIGASNQLTVTNAAITRAANLAISTTGSGTLALSSAASASNAVSLTTSGNGETQMVNSAAAYAGSVVAIGHSATKTYTSGGGTLGILSVAGAYTVGSGTGMFTDLTLTSTINQTGGTGITRGLWVIPTLTAVVDYRAVELTANSSHYAMYSTAGKWKINLGGDVTGDTYYRDASGNFVRLGIGSASQVLTGGTIPAWGSAPVSATKCYVTGVTGTTVDLDSLDGKTKDRDGSNVAFTIPATDDKFFVVRGGLLLDSDGAGGSPSRDYSVNTTTHVITFNEALTASETVCIYKFA